MPPPPPIPHRASSVISDHSSVASSNHAFSSRSPSLPAPPSKPPAKQRKRSNNNLKKKVVEKQQQQPRSSSPIPSLQLPPLHTAPVYSAAIVGEREYSHSQHSQDSRLSYDDAASTTSLRTTNAIDEVINEVNHLLQSASEAQALGRLRNSYSCLLLAHQRLVGVGRRVDRSYCEAEEDTSNVTAADPHTVQASSLSNSSLDSHYQPPPTTTTLSPPRIPTTPPPIPHPKLLGCRLRRTPRPLGHGTTPQTHRKGDAARCRARTGGARGQDEEDGGGADSSGGEGGVCAGEGGRCGRRRGWAGGRCYADKTQGWAGEEAADVGDAYDGRTEFGCEGVDAWYSVID